MAVVTDRKSFAWGAGLAGTFLVLLAALFSPILEGRSPMSRADEFFTSLTKGSTRFTDDLLAQARRQQGAAFTVAIRPRLSPENTRLLLDKAGCRTSLAGQVLTVSGDLGALGQAVVRDTDDMYRNDGQALRDRYGLEERETLVLWSEALTEMDRGFKAAGQREASDLCSCLLARGVEASYNFYGIEPMDVAGHVWPLAGLLGLYVLYAVWLGSGVYLIFRGLGLCAGGNAGRSLDS